MPWFATLLAVALGGALGAVLRFGGIQLLRLLAPGPFPLGTLTVNLLGCFLIGYLSGIFAHVGSLSYQFRAFVFVGCLGSFTTYSTYAFETLELLEQRHFGLAALNIFLSTVIGFLAALAGLHLAGGLPRTAA